MSVYTQAFAQRAWCGAGAAHQEDRRPRPVALCLRTTLMSLLEVGAVAVLNENDSVSVRELVEYRRTQTPRPRRCRPRAAAPDGSVTTTGYRRASPSAWKTISWCG